MEVGHSRTQPDTVGPNEQPSGADQAAVTLGNTDGEISGLTISDPPTQAEVQALRDKAEELADDVRALSTLVHSLRGALVAAGMVTDALCATDSFIPPPKPSLTHKYHMR